MNVRGFAVAALLGATLVSVSACNNGPIGGDMSPVAASGQCSDPNPSPASVTFAGVVCILDVTRVPQADGSVELELHVSVADKDPNAFDIAAWDFEVLDNAGRDVDIDNAAGGGRTGANKCIYQDLTDDGWPVQPGATFTIPGPICFNLAPGEQPAQLVWQGDVSVPVSSR